MRKTVLLLWTIVWLWGGSGLEEGLTQQTPAPPYEFKALIDIAYYDGPGFNTVKHRLDLFIPEGVKDVPVLFFVHGGGWTSGDKNLYAFIGQTFARQGFATVVINYRLTPEVVHPGHIEDVARAFAWVHKNIAQYGGNPEKIFVTGHSAGSHLSALLALDEKYLQAHGLTLQAIKGALPMSGVYDVTGSFGLYRAVFGADPQQRQDASPLTHVGPNRPPFFVIYAEFDLPGLGAQARQLASLLKQNGTTVELLEVSATNHVTIITNIGLSGDPTTAAMLAFIRTQLADALAPATLR